MSEEKMYPDWVFEFFECKENILHFYANHLRGLYGDIEKNLADNLISLFNENLECEIYYTSLSEEIKTASIFLAWKLIFDGTNETIGLAAFKGDVSRKVIENVYEIIDSLKIFKDQGITLNLNRTKNSIRMDNGNVLYSRVLSSSAFRGISFNSFYILRGNNYSTQFETNFHEFMTNIYPALYTTRQNSYVRSPVYISRSV